MTASKLLCAVALATAFAIPAAAMDKSTCDADGGKYSPATKDKPAFCLVDDKAGPGCTIEMEQTGPITYDVCKIEPSTDGEPITVTVENVPTAE